MSTELSELYPKKLWKNFDKICQIPRPSKHEQQMVQFIKEFGNTLKLDVYLDKAGNVIIRKPATKGMEQHKKVILQAHLDMVPQKTDDSLHNFKKDAIKPLIKDQWVTADHTTLGADNGIGVAAILAILQSNDISHGSIEALFTVDEETGMTGAEELEPDVLQGDILLNLDTEDEGELCIGCAGGIDTNIKLQYDETSIPKNSIGYKIKISGLKGGHSGMDIHLGRANSIKLLNRFLWVAAREYGLRIANINGGSLRNAIPRDAFAIVTVPKENKKKIVDFANEFDKIVKSEYGEIDDDIRIAMISSNRFGSLIDLQTQQKLLNAVYGCPDGIIRFNSTMNVVDTSTNLAVINSENGEISINTLQRSALDSARDDVCNMIRSIFEITGAEVEHSGAYPGWTPDLNSPVLKLMRQIYVKKTGYEPKVNVVHAGLECGLLAKKYPNIDMISFGPTIKYPHSPDEKVNISSVGKFWDYLLDVLKNIPKI